MSDHQTNWGLQKALHAGRDVECNNSLCEHFSQGICSARTVKLGLAQSYEQPGVRQVLCRSMELMKSFE